MQKGLRKKDLHNDPFHQFRLWYTDAVRAGVHDPSIMNLATVSPDGKPSSRIVLLKYYNENGFTFFTNQKSRKGNELAENPSVALTFYWPELERQIRIEGTAKIISDPDSEKYFRSRPKGSQISATISPQSEVIPERKFLDDGFSDFEKKHKNKTIQKPEYWGGYIVLPDRYEFWQNRANRLHDRIIYLKTDNNWVKKRLGP
jgi:pyridoxamine 5'-phosphate oxidase